MMATDVTALRQASAQAAMELTAQEAEARRIQAELHRKANEIGREILRILAQKGSGDLEPAEAVRLLRLVCLRMILLGDPNINVFAKSLPHITELFLGQKPAASEEVPPLDVEV